MREKSTNRKDFPTKKDCLSSVFLNELNKCAIDFDDEIDIKRKHEFFSDFLIHFDTFILSESNPKLISNYLPVFFREFIKNVNISISNYPSYVQSMKIISRASEIMKISMNFDHFFIFYQVCCGFYELYPSVLQLSKSFFLLFVKDSVFINDLFSSKNIGRIIEIIFIQYRSKELAQFFNSLVFEKQLPSVFSNVNSISVFEYISDIVKSQRIDERLFDEIVVFVSNVFYYCSFFVKSQSSFFASEYFPFFDFIVSKSQFQSRSRSYKRILLSCNDDLSQPPNLICYRHIYKVFSDTPPIQPSLFVIIMKLIQSNPSSIEQLNRVIPLSNWFNWREPQVSEMVEFVLVLNSSSPSYVSLCFPVLFRAMLQVDSDLSSVLLLIPVILEQLSSALVSPSFLLESNFLSVFILKPSPSILIDSFFRINGYCDMVIQIYVLPGAVSFQASVFQSILQMIYISNDNDMLVEICTKFLSAAPTEININQLLIMMEKEGNFEMTKSLCSVFVSYAASALNFVNIGGIDAVFDAFEKKLIPLDSFVELLSTLVCSQSFELLEQRICSLNDDHPLFNLSQSQLEKIVFGLNSSRNRPIRVHSLMHLFEKEFILDPYNAWLLSNAYVDQYLKKTSDIFRVPMIDQIANRYLNPKFIKYILEKPYDLEKFCNPSYDHFPLFQLYPGKNDFFIETQYQAISFWFRFNENPIDNTLFFSIDCLSASICNATLTIDSETNSYIFPIEANKWCFLAIKFESYLLFNSISIFYNGQMITSQSKQKRSGFSYASFGTNGKNMLFLGPSIRFFVIPPKSFTDLYKLGCSNIDPLTGSIETPLLTPYLLRGWAETASSYPKISLRVPSNCMVVPYFGFPMHFLSLRKLSKLFIALNQCNSQREFVSVFRTLLNIHEITGQHSDRFWPLLLDSLTISNRFLSKDVFLEGLVSASKGIKDSKVLSSFIFDKEMWKKVDNGLLIDVIFEYFVQFDLSSIEHFDIFLTNIVVENNGSIQIVTQLIKNYKKVPSMIYYLFSVIKVSASLPPRSYCWESFISREYNLIEDNIVSSFIKCLDDNTASMISRLIKFEEIEQLMMVCSSPITSKLFTLVSLISQYHRDYISPSPLIYYILSSNCTIASFWHDSILIINNCSQRIELFSFLLVLIFSVSIYSLINDSFGIQLCLSAQILEIYNSAVVFCSKRISDIVHSSELIELIMVWGTIFLQSPSILSKNTTLDFSNPDLNNYVPNLKDIEKYWNNLPPFFKDIEAPIISGRPRTTLFDIVFSSFGKSSYRFDYCDFNEIRFRTFMKKSLVLKFLADIVSLVPHSLSATLISCFLFSSKILHSKIPDLSCSIISQRLVESISNVNSFSILLSLLCFAASHSLLSHDVTDFTRGLLISFVSIGQKCGEVFFKKSSNQINCLLLFLSQYIETDALSGYLSVLSENSITFSQIIVQQNSFLPWSFIFSKFSHFFPSSSDTFLCVFSNYANTFDLKESLILQKLRLHLIESDDVIIRDIEHLYMGKIEEIRLFFLQSLNTYRIPSNQVISSITSLAKCIDQAYFSAHFSHYHLSHYFHQSIQYLKATYQYKTQMHQWNSILDKMNYLQSDVSTFIVRSCQNSSSSFPYSPPRLLTPSIFSSSNEFFALYRDNINYNEIPLSKNNNYLDLFYNFFSRFGNPMMVSQCVITRFSISFPSVLFFYHDRILLLTYSKLSEDYKDIEFLKIDEDFDFKSFLESIFIGQWGSTTIFASRIVIKIHFNSMIYGSQNGTNSIIVWSFDSGSFIIEMSKNDMASFMTIFSKEIDKFVSLLPPIPFLFHFRSISELNNKWNAGLLNNSQSLLVINALNNRFFISPMAMPVFPNILFDELHYEPNRDFNQTLDEPPIVYRNDSFYASQKTEFPAIVYYNPMVVNFSSFFCRNLFYKYREILDSSIQMKEISNWAINFFKLPYIRRGPNDVESKRKKQSFLSFDNHFVSQSLLGNLKNNQTIYHENDSFVKLPSLSCRLDPLKTVVAILEPSKMSLSFFDYKTHEFYMKHTYDLFVYGSSLNVSHNGAFLVVDFQFGMSKVFRIIYNDSFPSTLVSVSSFNWESTPKSAISGTDWLCASAFCNTLVLWNVFSSLIHRVVEFKDDIRALSFDEVSSLLWLSASTHCFVLNMNGEILSKSKFDDTITVISVLNTGLEESKRSAILGTEQGIIYIATPSYDTAKIDYKKLSSVHSESITSIVISPLLNSFLSTDISGSIASNTAIGIKSQKMKLSIINKCPICLSTNQLTYCSSCNRAVCEKCLNTSQQESLCQSCLAITTYF